MSRGDVGGETTGCRTVFSLIYANRSQLLDSPQDSGNLARPERRVRVGCPAHRFAIQPVVPAPHVSPRIALGLERTVAAVGQRRLETLRRTGARGALLLQ